MQNKSATRWLTLQDDITKETARRIVNCYGHTISRNPDLWLRKLPNTLQNEIMELLKPS